jgi:hypothetical protein
MSDEDREPEKEETVDKGTEWPEPKTVTNSEGGTPERMTRQQSE